MRSPSTLLCAALLLDGVGAATPNTVADLSPLPVHPTRSRSHFLTQLGPLWQHLERSWTRAIHPAHIATFLRSKSAPSLGTIWARFEGEVQRQMGGEEVEGLFGKLLSGQGEKVVREQDGEEEEDGPPPLLEGSADESDASSGPPSLYAAHSEEEEEEDDSDVPPPLYAYANSTSDSDSDSDGPPPLTRAPARPSPPPTARRPTLPTRRPPRPRPATRAHHLPSSSTSAEPQPGPSHSARRPEVDMSGLRPDHEFGVRRDGVRSDEVGEAEEQQEGRRREKRKTRKAGGDGGSSTTGGETETETETETESETEGAAGGRRRGFAEDASFQVSRKVYATFEQYIGIGAHISRCVVFLLLPLHPPLLASPSSTHARAEADLQLTGVQY